MHWVKSDKSVWLRVTFQSPEAALLLVSTKTGDHWEGHQKSVIHGLLSSLCACSESSLTNLIGWQYKTNYLHMLQISDLGPVSRKLQKRFGPRKTFFNLYLTRGGGGTPRKIGWRCAARFSEPLPYLWPKSVIFPTLFMTWPKIRNPIYDPTLTSKSCFKPAL